jgi:O-acetyl-ADP-ribose deacetylase (regulator of RNase III)
MKTITKNMLDAEVDVAAHCSNCFCTMGTGIALSIKNRYPEAYAADCQTKKGDINKLGTFSIAKVKPYDSGPLYIANLYGQYTYGRDSRKLNYEAIYNAISGLKSEMLNLKLKTVAFPYLMGCMNAGGNWEIVSKMIEVVFKDSGIDVIICKLP